MATKRAAVDAARKGPGVHRKLAILDAAEALFLEKGFERTTANDVILASGGSLATLYSLFGSKEGLLAAVLERRLEASVANMTAAAQTTGHPAEVLRKLARSLMEFVGSQVGRSMLKLLVGASIHDPALGRRFHEGPWNLPANILAPLLREWTESGQAKVDHPLEAAQLFWAMVLVDIPIETLLGIRIVRVHDDVLERRIAPFFQHFEISEAGSPTR